MRLLIVEDSVKLAESLANGLRKAGYAVDVASDGASGLWQAQAGHYDVVILDYMLPGLDGVEVLTRLRQGGHAVHVLMLTARDAVEDRVKGLRAGADDYLVKPFAFDELLARIEVLTRRSHDTKSPTIVIGDVTINTAARTVVCDGRGVDLTRREYGLLEYLAFRRGSVVSRGELESHLYDEQAELMSNVVDATIYSLRKKLGGDGRSLIQTRRGMGYLIAEDDSAGPA